MDPSGVAMRKPPPSHEKAGSESPEYLDLKAMLILLVLTLIWGLNYPLIKFTNQGIAPIFSSTLRSAVASICGILYCLRKGHRLLHTDIMLFHGSMVGLLFGLEFACLYLGLLYTDAARSVIFVYLSPFVTTVGAHFFLRGDRLSLPKLSGLLLAFVGIVSVFSGKPRTAAPAMLLGDVLEVMAAFFWGTTTLYIKKFMAQKVHPIHTFLYQLLFSIPVLFALSYLLEPRWVYRIDLPIVASLFYQAIIYAFISLLIWFNLIHRYPVSRLSAFTFFTPIFGVLFGLLFLGEEFTPSLMAGLPMVCLGIFLVNWKPKNVSPSRR
jgi:drug/metabolite transporter (DMT)-like permease